MKTLLACVFAATLLPGAGARLQPAPPRPPGPVPAAATRAFEKPDLGPGQLAELATHIVVGEVTALYTRVETGGGWETTRYLAEVRLESVEKGEGLQAGQLAYVRYWHRRWTGWGSQPPDTNGHRGLPREGDRVRIHLARDAYDGYSRDNTDGGLNVIGANGFEVLPGGPPSDPRADDDPAGR